MVIVEDKPNEFLDNLNIEIITQRDAEVILEEYESGKITREQYIGCCWLAHSITSSKSFTRGWESYEKISNKRKMKSKSNSKIFAILVFLAVMCILLLTSCNRAGDYCYIIYMKDGSTVKAWSATASGGGLFVITKWGEQEQYYLSSEQYSKAVYIGLENDNN